MRLLSGFLNNAVRLELTWLPRECLNIVGLSLHQQIRVADLRDWVMVERWLLHLHRHWKCSDRPNHLIRKGLNSSDASKAFVEDLSLDKKTFESMGSSSILGNATYLGLR